MEEHSSLSRKGGSLLSKGVWRLSVSIEQPSHMSLARSFVTLSEAKGLKCQMLRAAQHDRDLDGHLVACRDVLRVDLTAGLMAPARPPTTVG